MTGAVELNYLSVASGIEAASVAWKPLGWHPIAFAQFDPEHKYKNGPDFASAVLAHHYAAATCQANRFPAMHRRTSAT